MDLSNEQLQGLVNELAIMITNDNESMRESSANIANLLQHAISMLNESFFSVNQEIKPNQPKTNAHPENEDVSPGEGLLGALQKALTIATNLNQMLGRTTQSLQVEDIITQILSHLTMRSKQVDHILSDIKNLITLPGSSNQNYEDILARIKKHNAEVRLKSVQQTSLDMGALPVFS